MKTRPRFAMGKAMIVLAVIQLKLMFTGSVKFTNSPPEILTAFKGDGVWFPWTFSLEGKTLLLYKCGYFNASSTFMVIAEGKNSFSALKENVTAYRNYTFALVNVDFKDEATYSCKIFYKNGNVTELSSSKSRLIVKEKTKNTKDGLNTGETGETGEIVGIVVGIASLVLILVLAILWKRNKLKCFSSSKGAESQTNIWGKQNFGYPSDNDNSDVISVSNEVQAFKNHYKNIKNNQNLVHLEYEELKRDRPIFTSREASIALNPKNRSKNRNPDIIPRNGNLVSVSGYNDGKYLNAIYVNGYHRKREFIVTQFPSEEDHNDLWEMVFIQKVNVIIVLCGLMDPITNKSFLPFWPAQGVEIKYGKIKVRAIEGTSEPDMNTTELIVQEIQTKEAVRVLFIQFHLWSNQTTPESKETFIKLLLLYYRSRDEGNRVLRPSMLICSDGATQSGTFIASSILMNRFFSRETINVNTVAKDICYFRPQFLGDTKSYIYCYEIIAEYLENYLEADYESGNHGKK